MKDRIKKIMDEEDLSPAKFADQLHINRAVVSHILNGRNNPSLDVVTKILTEKDYINADWLLNGSGSMYKEGYTAPTSQNEGSLFDTNVTDKANDETKSEYTAEKGLNTPVSRVKHTGTQHIQEQTGNTKKVKQIIIYYTDNTFETFTPH